MAQRVVVIAFEDEARVHAALQSLQHLAQEETLDLADAVVMVKERDGTVHLRQTDPDAGAGAVGGGMAIGGWFGFFAGLLLVGPIAGLATGTAAAALARRYLRRLADTGLDDTWIRQTATSIQPGMSALFLLISADQLEPVLVTLRTFHGTILYTDLPADVRLHVEDALHDEQARATVQPDVGGASRPDSV